MVKINEEAACDLLKAAAEAEGSMANLSRKWGYSKRMLSDISLGKKPMPQVVAVKLGLKRQRITTYVFERKV
jgi:hypothetical protein